MLASTRARHTVSAIAGDRPDALRFRHHIPHDLFHPRGVAHRSALGFQDGGALDVGLPQRQ